MMSAFMFPIYLETNKIQKKERIRGKTEGTTEDRETWYQERPAVGPNRTRERQKLTHGNLQISKNLCIIIRSCNLYEMLDRINISVDYI